MASEENNDDASGVATSDTIWFKEDEHWELTWPIWHMLPWTERKALAKKYGYKKIGDFEEYMTLSRAVGDSTQVVLRGDTTTLSSGHQRPYDNELMYNVADRDSKQETVMNVNPKAKIRRNEDDSDEDEDDDEGSVSTNSGSTSIEDNGMDRSKAAASEELLEDELLQRAGEILKLPEELLHHVLNYVPIDMYASCALVSPHWSYFTRTEAVYKRLCERVYLRQSKRKSLHVARFNHSYHSMLQSRPRVRAGGGVYVLRYKSVKKIQRDMWTEIPLGAVLETVYYRYLWFQEDGRVMYALTTSPPHEMIRRMMKARVTNEPDKAAVWGNYVVQKNNLIVTARQEWQTVRFQLTIVPESIYGRFGALTLDRHLSSYSGSFQDEFNTADIVDYQVPNEIFRFLKDRRM